MFERFTERARQVVVLAQEEAEANHNCHVSIHHLLKGLVREAEGVAGRVLNEMGYVPTLVGLPTFVNPKDETHPVPFTAQTKQALELALREALSLGHNYIGTEHVLLGVLRATEGEDIGLDHEKTRKAVLEYLNGPGGSRRAKATPKAGLKSVESEPKKTPEPDARKLAHDLVDISFGWIAAAQMLVEALRS